MNLCNTGTMPGESPRESVAVVSNVAFAVSEITPDSNAGFDEKLLAVMFYGTLLAGVVLLTHTALVL